MPQISVKKIEDTDEQTLPIFQEIAKKLDAVKQRAFELFTKRGQEHGHDMEDWLQAEEEILGLPAAELTEKDNTYELVVALPGFQAKDIEVATTPSEIVIHAAMRHEKKEKEDGVVRSEFGSQDLLRRFELPSRIEADKVVANLKKGALHIVAPQAGRSVSAVA